MQFRSALIERSLVGTFVGIGNPTVVEILGRSGFEFVCIDSEHAPFSPTDIQELVRAADSVGVPAIVRVSSIGPEIGRALDSGAAGVLVPKVETAAQAQSVVDAVRYPPIGSRGAGPGRAAGYGKAMANYLSHANDEVGAIIQIETVAAVENVEAIVRVPGLDMVFIGPGDLSVSLGVESGSAEHSAAIKRIAAAARAAGVPLGIFVLDAASIAQWVAEGATLFLLTGDLGMLAATSAQIAADGRAAALSEVTA